MGHGIEKDIIDGIVKNIEKDTGKKIFTIRVLEQTEEGLDTLIVFKDKSVMMGLISIENLPTEDGFACRIRGHFI